MLLPQEYLYMYITNNFCPIAEKKLIWKKKQKTTMIQKTESNTSITISD